MKRQQIITLKVTYDDNACDEECIASDECCTPGTCDDIVEAPVDFETSTLQWDADEIASQEIQILQASPPREA